MHKKILILSAILIYLTSAGFGSGQNTDTKKLNKLFEDDHEFCLREYPQFATFYGDHRFDDKLSDVSLEGINRRAKQALTFLDSLKTINRARLSDADKINYDIFKCMLEEGVEWNQLQSYLMPINHIGGFHTDFAQLSEDVPLNNVKDYENYISRLNAFKLYTQQHIDLMKEGIRKGFVLPGIIAERIPKSLETLLAEDINESKLFEPFKKYPPIITSAQQRCLAAEGLTAIKETVRPSYQQLLKFINETYIPACRKDIAISSLPNGREYYKQCIYSNTTLHLDPRQLHQTGLSEVKRIRQEMDKLIKQTGFDGDFNSFKKYLSTDKRFRVETPEQLLKEVAYILKRTDGQLPKYFSRLPRMPVGLKEVPEYIQAQSPEAYYSGPPMDGTRAGFYYINTYNVKDRTLYGLTATSLHETNPGHHLQICLQQEPENMPQFRKTAHFTAYVEGWALYAEMLGEEMGIYQDAYSRFGRLDNEIWRACRLVVDTGIHSLGWSRQQAIGFMAENTTQSREHLAVEVDRYIVWPGQALSYKVGEMKILELRRLAEEKLGEKFDIRQFHNVILDSGAIPLDMLEDNVNRWISRKSENR